MNKNGFEVKIICDSISTDNKRITTMQLRYPRFIHAEFMTHRVFSRNASSSRAIPVAKMLKQVREEPAMPIHWGKNQPGMQAKEEHDAKVTLIDYRASEFYDTTIVDAWKIAAEKAAEIAEAMAEAGYHKQVVNRILEPFQFIHVVVTATEWDNFFELRAHADAQPEIRLLAEMMQTAMNESIPNLLDTGRWHLPYVEDNDYKTMVDHLKVKFNLIKEPTQSQVDLELTNVSAARCCRVSYLKHNGEKATIQEELDLCERLVGSRPIHASPFEHQATPDLLEGNFKIINHEVWKNQKQHGNLKGWIQYRKLIEISSI